MIKYVGTRKVAEGNTVHVFVVNGQQKEVKETSLKQHPGYFDAMPHSVQERINNNKKWISQI